MKHQQAAFLGLCLWSGLFFSPAVIHADTPEQVLERYAEQARKEDPSWIISIK
jgi:hypothetical protein